MKGNYVEKVLNVLFVMSWLAIAGTIIFSLIIKDRVTVYNYGSYLYNLSRIDLFALIIIFMKSVVYDRSKR